MKRLAVRRAAALLLGTCVAASALAQAPATKKPQAARPAVRQPVIEQHAVDLLKAMSARLAAANSLSFSATASYEYPSRLGPLLDVMLGQPLAQLLRSIPVPQQVSDALVHGSGRYRPYLDLVRAVEQESLFDIREAAETLLLAPAEVNRALLRALMVAQQLE